MTPAQLSSTVLHTVRRAAEADELGVPVPELPERVVVQSPPRPGCGDYATNVALQLAGPAGRGALEVAAVLRRRLADAPGIARVEIAGPGFLNITLDDGSRADLVRTVLREGRGYGHGHGLAGTTTELPDEARGDVRTGLHTAVLARLVRACGGDVRFTADAPRPRPVPLTARELLVRLGPDAARWALLRTPAQDAPGLDPGVLLAQRESNPLFRVRYAHARARALRRNGRDLAVTGAPAAADGNGAPADAAAEGNAAAYGHPAEAALLAVLRDHPRALEAAARHRAPDRLARHLEAVADAFFRCHDACPALPRGGEKPLAVHRSRLALAEAAGTVLAGGLHRFGITAPEHL